MGVKENESVLSSALLAEILSHQSRGSSGIHLSGLIAPIRARAGLLLQD